MNKIKIVQGDDEFIPLHFFYRDEDGNKVDIDLTGAVLTYKIKNFQGDASALITVVVDISTQSESVPTEGLTYFPLTAVQTASLDAGKPYYWKVSKVQDSKKKSICYGELEVCIV